MGITRLTLLLALPAALWAGPEPEPEAAERPKPKAEAGATVTVTAEATQVEVVKTPNPVKVITLEQIEREAPRTLADLLASRFPGQLVSNGGVGTISSFNLAGARSQDVVVTLDGIRLTDPTGFGSVTPSSIGLVGIERIEVQQGPCSSRFGSEAMGGVVALYSAGGAEAGLKGEAMAGVGSQSIQRGRLAVSYGFEKGWVRAALQGDQEAQATETDKDFRSQGAFLSSGWNLGEDHLLTVTYRNTFQGVPIPYQSVSPTARVYDADRETSTRSQQLIASLRSALGETIQADLSLGHATTARQEPNDYAGSQEPFKGHRNQVVGGLHWDPATTAGLSLGVDAYEEFARISDYSGGFNEGEGRYLAANLEGRWQPVEALRLVGSYRQQWFRQAFVFSSFPGVPEDTESKGTWKLGINTVLGGGHRLYASGGSGFGLPYLYAVMYQAKTLLDPGSWQYDPAAYRPLQPEESTFLQAGWTWERGPWSARVEASRTTFDRLLYFDLNQYVYANGQNIRIQGVEGSLAYRTETWGLEGFARSQEARDLDAPEAQRFQTNAVIRRPFAAFGLSGHWASGPWRADVRWSWTGSRYENFGGYPAMLGASKVHFNDVAATLRYRLNAAFDLALRGEHLLQDRWTVAEWENRAMDGRNDAYQVFGFPAQPRTVSLEARYRF
ncbi:MAG: Vitamin B12 transporter BtuB precursor [Acidobacteria bacterium ADurb.Bin340]|nr:MAG: Vitamin B12 transporter BtuB precursor [Acidobacteria bacterium ADurb.Bin340]